MAIVAECGTGVAMRIDKFVNCGPQGYFDNETVNDFFYAYVENMFDPMRFLVKGENLQDAWDWLICDPAIEEMCEVDEIADYCNDPSHTHFFSADFYECATESGRITWNDNGKALDTEALMIREVTRLSITFEPREA